MVDVKQLAGNQFTCQLVSPLMPAPEALFYDRRAITTEPGYPNFGGPGFLPSGALGGWSVGNTAGALPNDMGRYLKKGSDLVMQLHYHPTGREERDQSEVGLYFVKRPVAEVLKERAKLVGSIWLANYEIDIFLLTADKIEDLIHTIFDNLVHDAKQARPKVAKAR